MICFFKMYVYVYLFILFLVTLVLHQAQAHPASAGKPPLHANTPLFGHDFGRVRGTRRKGTGAPAKVQLKSLMFLLSTKSETPFLTPFLTAAPSH